MVINDSTKINIIFSSDYFKSKTNKIIYITHNLTFSLKKIKINLKFIVREESNLEYMKITLMYIITNVT